MCARWASFANFLADMGPRPESKTLDRVDNNGDYEPSNCQWATNIEQLSHTRRTVYLEYKGVSKPVAVWAREKGINRKTVMTRLGRGWSATAALEGHR